MDSKNKEWDDIIDKHDHEYKELVAAGADTQPLDNLILAEFKTHLLNKRKNIIAPIFN